MKSFSSFSVLVTLIAYGLAVQAAPRLVRRQGDPQSSLTLDPRVIQKSISSNGLGGNTSEPGQVASLTSTNNFINFCLQFTKADGTQGDLTDGQQKKGGSCNPTPMGVIPSSAQMPSAKFSNPVNLQNFGVNQSFTIQMNIQNMETGNFVNPNTNYFAAPQQLNPQGLIVGHSHVVIQPIKSINDPTPADSAKFDFFQGLNAAAQGGVLTSSVSNGLNAGTYRLCSINTAANHQPVLVAVAQHGSLDDCVYFTVGDQAAQAVKDLVAGGNAGTNNAAAAPPATGANNAAAASSAATSSAAAATSSASAASATTSAAAAPAAASALPASPDPSKPFLPANGQAAQQLNAKFATLTTSSSCQEGDQACLNGGFAQCVGGKFQVVGCAGGTQCFALPLVNKVGTSVTCDTQADAIARIAATGVTGGLTGSG